MDPSVANQHSEELRTKYPELSLVRWRGQTSIEGLLRFVAELGRHFIEDEYAIKISLPDDYPETPPVAEELMGRIPRSHHHYQNGHLCLGALFAIARSFHRTPTLLGFTDNCLVPYLYSFSYKSQYGRMPYGELSHGRAGITDFYSEEFGVSDPGAVIGLLRMLANDLKCKGTMCPCGSRKSAASCHGKKLEAMLLIRPAGFFDEELRYLMSEIGTRTTLDSLGVRSAVQS